MLPPLTAIRGGGGFKSTRSTRHARTASESINLLLVFQFIASFGKMLVHGTKLSAPHNPFSHFFQLAEISGNDKICERGSMKDLSDINDFSKRIAKVLHEGAVKPSRQS